MTGTAVAPYGFSLRLPESWFEFDVWRATRTGDLARLVDARIKQTPELVPRRGALLRMLRIAAGEAERQGARSCAVLADLVDDEGMLAATSMVFQTSGAAGPAENTVESIAGQVTATAAKDGTSTWRRVEVVEIPAGRAVRVYGVEMADLGGEASTDCVVMQTLLPVPCDRGVLNVVFTSPQVQLADSLLDLFDAISATLAWLPDASEEIRS